MATAGDGATPYQSGGAGGKFRKRPIRRSAQATPYDRPPTALRNNSPSLFAKLVDPASRLIYAGADRLFGVFRKRLPSIAAPPPPETREEPEPSIDEGGNLASISATTEISELESMLKQKTFTRSEIEHLTALLHAKTTNSDGDEGDKAKQPSPSSYFLRLEASTSSPPNKHLEERENMHTAIITPAVTSRAFEEDIASPAELARAYMGTRTPKVSPTTLRFGSQAPRQDSVLLNTTTILPKTPITSLAPRTTATYKGLENGLTTPRSRGRSAIYSMARTPYSRPPSVFSQKGHNSPSLPLSQPAWEQEMSVESSKMALKRRSSVLDDIGSGGPVRRIRQKANLLSQGSPLSNNRNGFRQKLLLRNEPDFKSSKSVEENGETSRSNLGYASVPTKSTQMATKILEQLERLSPKEKSPASRLARSSEKLPLTSNTIHIQEKADSPKVMSSSQDSKKPESSLLDARESTSQSKGKEKVEENGPKKFAVPRNVLSTMNGNSAVSIRDNGPIATNTDSTFKLPLEPPQKKRFQMSAHEDNLEVDDGSHSNGHVSIPFGQNKKPGASVFAFANKDVSAEAIQTPAVSQVDKIPSAQKTNDAKSLLKTDFGSVDGSAVSKKVTFNFTPSGNTTQAAVLPHSASITDTQKKATGFPTFGATTNSKNAENVSPFSFSANNETSGFKPHTSSDSKPLTSTSLFSSVKENNEVQFQTLKKDDDNGNAVSKSESSSSSATSGIFSFGAKNTNGSPPASTPSTFASSSAFPASTALFTSTTTTTSASSGALPTSTPAPGFSFGSAMTSSPKSAQPPETTTTTTTTTTTSPFGSNPSTGINGLFGFRSPAATSTTNDHHSQGFQPSFTTVQSSSTSGTPLFGSSAPAFGTFSSFGLSSAAATSDIKSGGSTTLPTSTPPTFGLASAWEPPKSSTPTTTTAATFSFGASSSSSPSSSPSVFGSSSIAGASTGPSMFSFTATSSAPSLFGNTTPVFGSAAAASPNNDHMSMEDSMAEDSTPTPSFGQPSSPNFLFGSATPPPPTLPTFQFGGQTNQPLQNPFQTPSQNPFQASGSGSFSLGSGGGDKSGRRILKVKSKNRRK